MRVQLKKPHSIKHALTAVTAALVGATPAGSAGLNHSETSILIYSERDRVHATEAMFSLDRQMPRNYRLNLRLTFDGLTGASPTGGAPSKRPQTLTRPSGGSKVLVAAGELPVDRSFRETRFGADVGLSRRFSAGTTVSGELHLSSEHDYRSIGLKGGLTRDLDNAKTSVGLQVSVMRDISSPLGGVPAPFEPTTVPGRTQNGNRISNNAGHKRIYDAVFSLTRVLGPNLLARISYTANYAEGYLTDPYKEISVVQPADSADPGEPVSDLYESRPSKRASNALSCDLRTFVFGMAAETDYRYFWDDWGIRSHTVSASLNLKLRRNAALSPHVRWYRQSRANFSRPFLVQGEPLPDHASADSRMAAFDALTCGVSYSVPTSPSSRLTLTAEWYSKRGDRSPPEAFGPLLAFNLFPDLNAVMLRVGLAHDF
jgi:hypothetical protein